MSKKSKSLKPKWVLGSMIRMLAISPKEVFYLIVAQEEARSEKKGTARDRSQSKRTAEAACIVAIRLTAISKVKRASNRLVGTIIKDSRAGKVQSDLASKLQDDLKANLAGQFRVMKVSTDELNKLVGSPAMVAGKVATLSEGAYDKTTKIATGLAAAVGVKPGAAAVGGYVATKVSAATGTAMVGLYSGTTSLAVSGGALAAGLVVGGVVVSGAGGWVAGVAINEGLTAILSGIAGKEGYTLGDLAFDGWDYVAGGSDDTPAAAPAGDEETETTSDAPPTAGASTEEDDKTEEEKEKEEEEKKEEEDANNDNAGTTDDTENENDDDETDDAGTTIDPELQSGSSVGSFIMFAATGLCRTAVKQQLAAFDIAAGGALGVHRQKATDLHWDRMLGGLYLRTILRGISAQRNKHGYREENNTIVALPDSRMFINGFVCPPPMRDIKINGLAAAAT